MKLLVTGGCGFLGSNVAAAFLEKDAEVCVLDAMFRRGADANKAWLESKAKPGQLSMYKGDLADAEFVSGVLKKHRDLDYVCHLAGQVAMTTSLSDPRRDLLTNVVGTFNVLEAVREHSPGALLAYSSTNKVYGDLETIECSEQDTRYVVPSAPDGFAETLPLDFASPYGCSKGAADQYVRDWFRNFGLRTVVFRHSSIYGGRQFATFDQGWIGWFCMKALEQRNAIAAGRPPEPFTIQGTGKQVRDVLHADDLVRLYEAAFEKRTRIAGEIFNIGGGMANSLSLLELFSLLEDILSLPTSLAFVRLERRRSDQNFFVADISKAVRLLSWKPQVAARDGISRMLSWLREENAAARTPG